MHRLPTLFILEVYSNAVIFDTVKNFVQVVEIDWPCGTEYKS